VPLLVLLIWAAVEDKRSRRVPNWLSFSLILSGLALAALPWGHIPFEQSIAGCGAGFGMAMLLYLLRGIGAGDVKLLAGIGAWLGVWPVVAVFAVSAVIGMILALALGTRQGRLGAVVRGGILLGAGLAQGQPVDAAQGLTLQGPAKAGPSSMRGVRGLPYATALAMSTAGIFVARWLSLRFR